jgi:hypothetical protein
VYQIIKVEYNNNFYQSLKVIFDPGPELSSGTGININTSNNTSTISINAATQDKLGGIKLGKNYGETGADNKLPLKIDDDNNAFIELNSGAIGAVGGSFIKSLSAGTGIKLYKNNVSSSIGVLDGSGAITIKEALTDEIGGIKV